MDLVIAKREGCFGGIKINGMEEEISHLFYDDDDVLLYPWMLRMLKGSLESLDFSFWLWILKSTY